MSWAWQNLTVHMWTREDSYQLSACTYMQSDQSLLSLWRHSGSLAAHKVASRVSRSLKKGQGGLQKKWASLWKLIMGIPTKWRLIRLGTQTCWYSGAQLSHLMRLWYFSSSSEARCLIFGRTLHLLPYFRLAWAFAGPLCDKYHNLMSWLN